MPTNLRETTAGGAFTAVLLMVSMAIGRGTANIVASEQPSSSFGETTITVCVDNMSGIPAGSLRLAEDRAADVFRQIGAHVLWVDREATVRQHAAAMFTLVMVSVEQDHGPYSSDQDALGFAAPQAHRAWVFWDRIEALKDHSESIRIVLGDVMAHELGHLMLPSPSHSGDGIMRPNIGKRFRSTETFTRLQTREIFIRLQQIVTADDSSH
jgi:hypothetical protein